MPTGDASQGRRSQPSTAADGRRRAPRSIAAESDFERIYRTGRSHSSRLLVIHYAEGSEEATRVGFVAGRRVGTAVQRNRAKRLMREAARQLVSPGTRSWDMVFVARRPTAEATAGDVRDAMSALLRRVGIERGPG